MAQELVAALIIKEGRVLLVHNRKHALVRVEPPGGKIHANESHIESLEREVYEELGVMVGNFRFFGTYRTDSPEGEFPVHIYLCDITRGEPEVREPEKIPAFGWYTLDEIYRLRDESTLVPNMVEALEDLERHLES